MAIGAGIGSVVGAFSNESSFIGGALVGGITGGLLGAKGLNSAAGIGAGIGAAWGAVSDSTSMMGGMAAGALGGFTAGKYGSRTLKAMSGKRAPGIGSRLGYGAKAFSGMVRRDIRMNIGGINKTMGQKFSAAANKVANRKKPPGSKAPNTSSATASAANTIPSSSGKGTGSRMARNNMRTEVFKNYTRIGNLTGGLSSGGGMNNKQIKRRYLGGI